MDCIPQAINLGVPGVWEVLEEDREEEDILYLTEQHSHKLQKQPTGAATTAKSSTGAVGASTPNGKYGSSR